MVRGWSKYNEAKRVMEDAAYRAVEKSTLVLQSEIQANAPVDTSELRGSIGRNVDGANRGYVNGQVGTSVHYFPFVEWGTGEFAENGAGRKGGWAYPVIGERNSRGEQVFRFTYGQKPQRFFRDAWERNEERVLKVIEDEFRGVSF